MYVPLVLKETFHADVFATGQGDRSVYMNSPLCVQVITPKLHDYELCQAMEVIDGALRDYYGRSKGGKPML